MVMLHPFDFIKIIAIETILKFYLIGTKICSL